MKRTSESPGHSGREKAYRRQNPVSCSFCRSKKLKCDRVSPCSNCVARGIDCDSPISSRIPVSNDVNAQTHNQLKSSFQQNTIDDLTSRLLRLEEAVFSRPNDDLGSYQHPSFSLDASNRESDPAVSSNSRLSPAEVQLSPEYVSRQIKKSSERLQVGETQESEAILPEQSNETFVDIMMQSDTIESRFLGNPPLQPEIDTQKNILSCSEISMALPSRALASVLFEHYASTINWVYRIIHVPTARGFLDAIYDDINKSKTPNIPRLALISTILAIGAYFWTERQGVRLTQKEAFQCAKVWGVFSKRCLVQCNYEDYPTVEALQAAILSEQYLPLSDKTTSLRASLGVVLRCAHILRLHQIDSKREIALRTATGNFSIVDLEIKRRLWWHIVSSDWILSFMTGPQEGTYLVQPDQMRVLYPSNADDDDITATEVLSRDFDGPPTEMTYTIGKLWFASAVRGIVDTINKSGLLLDELGYDQILAIDKQFTTAFAELPFFFKLDEASRRKSSEFEKKRPYIAWQRTMIHFGYHTRLSRVHRPYLTRGYKDPRFAYSRMVCLRSARAVIELERSMREMHGGFNPDPSKLWIIVHHFFTSTVTLVMDYCCHRDEPQAAERKQEILNCYKTLGQSQEQSAIAKEGLAHLKKVMRNWREKTDSDRPDTSANGLSRVQEAGQMFSREQQPNGVPEIAPGEPIGFDGMDMGIDVMQDLWLHSFNPDNPSFDPQWDALFRDLDNQPGIFG